MNVIIQDYLRSLMMESGHYLPRESDLQLLKKVGLKNYITAKLFSKKYRKWKLDNECLNIVEKEVDEAIQQNRPINIFFAQGCYKLWRVKSAPYPNWAEYFNISYLISYLSPIVASYVPGVKMTYYFLTVLPQTHNNLSQEEVDSYKEGFMSLINEFKNYLPDNFVINVETELDNRTRIDYDIELQSAMIHAEENFYAWNQAKQTDYIRRAWLNIKWEGVEKWDKYSDDQKLRLVKKAVLYEYAATQDILNRDKMNRGIILSTLQKEDSIGIGSTYTSVAKHWVGVGVLEGNDSHDLHARILSPSQYGLAQMSQHIEVPINFMKTKGFSQIEVYPRYFDFTKK